MKSMAATELLEKGIAFLKEGNTLGALACFEKAYALDKTPELQSYLGFCIAVERGQTAVALGMCEDAISKDPQNTVHYLNYSRVCLKANKREDAITTLRKGLTFGDSEEIRRILENLGIRKNPVFPFLPRSNFLNKYLGLLLHRLRLR